MNEATGVEAQFSLTKTDEVLELERNDALLDIDFRFEELSEYLSEGVMPYATQPFIDFYYRDQPDYEDNQLNRLVEQMTPVLDFLRTADKDQSEETIRNHMAGLFIMAGLDHEPNPEEAFEELLAQRKADFDEMLLLDEAQLRERFRLNEEQSERVNTAVFGSYFEDVANNLLKVMHANFIGATIGSDEVKAAVLAETHRPMFKLIGPFERNIHGLYFPDTEKLVNLTIDGIAKLGLLADGQELLWEEDREDRVEIGDETIIKVSKFILKCETESK